jgi:hypothetical protein
MVRPRRVAVIPGRHAMASPESIATDRGYKFRAASLHSAYGVTTESFMECLLLQHQLAAAIFEAAQAGEEGEPEQVLAQRIVG